ncbi:MAG: histidine phosphatase family protein [bacterium]|nr:histidine phosphatase family protein [bacterium]
MIWWILRHFPTEHNTNLIPQGHHDVPLSKDGRKQLQSFLSSPPFHPKPEIIYSSCLQRAKETAQVIGQYYQIPIHYDDRLNEWNIGERSGKTQTEFLKLYPNFEIRYDDLDFRYPNGESKRELYHRVQSFYNDLLSTFLIPLIVSHRGAINCFICHALHFPPNPWMPFHVRTGGIAAVNPFAKDSALLYYESEYPISKNSTH